MSSTVEITVLYFAALREQAGKEQETLAVAAGSTPAALYEQLARQYNFSLPQERIRAAVNHAFADWTQPLAERDIVAFIPPVAGG
ncbi:molybdopterin converting factor subunit 1 [Eikenella sp. S3360]|uniref:Molybdopterin synthase sulfur carrier subunit n=1 Tax=Eikenella glucosivorans TaxID=2766967 RepID=A0ABS0N854_9NEIS|nr:molybdopterin converting factor subunit 1 [Eikenella glucosivorans]MBH5328493.1 molybdopterin converting factor subunit 1 [Eikenella glucosivorans]